MFCTQVSLTSLPLWVTQKYKFCPLTHGSVITHSLTQLKHKMETSWLHTNHKRTHTTRGSINMPVTHQKNKPGEKKSLHQIFALHHVAAAVYLFQ